jgi:hypothetical protein
LRALRACDPVDEQTSARPPGLKANSVIRACDPGGGRHNLIGDEGAVAVAAAVRVRPSLLSLSLG